MAKKIKVQDVIQVHGVMQGDGDTRLELHTHGLGEFKHPELSVIAESIFYVSACKLLNSLCDAVINKKEVFKDGETCQWGEWGNFRMETNIDSGSNLVLRIESLPRECEVCGTEGDDEG